MQCDEARTHLFDFADGALSARLNEALTLHLDRCSQCRTDYQNISDLVLQAAVWHEVPPPRWQPPRMASAFSMGALQQWFPTLASALALVLVAALYLRPPAAALPATPVQSYSSTMPTESALAVNASLETALSHNRLERQQELQALVALLRAEMDRRNEETEESLRYVISHQIQGQREIDDLYQYIRKVSGKGQQEHM